MFKLLGINLVVSIFIYLISSILMIKEKIYLTILSMVMPIIGAVVAIFYILFKKTVMDTSEVTRKVMLYKEEENLLNNYSETGISIIPIKDALVLNEKKVKRKLIIHAIKDNPEDYVVAAKEALKDEDTETSHYAASVLTHLASRLPEAVKENEEKYINSSKDILIGIEYHRALKAYIDSGIDDNSLMDDYLEKYIELLKELILKSPTESYYEDILNVLIKNKRYDEAQRYIVMFKRKYTKTDKPYIIALKLAYQRRDFKEMKRELDALRSSKIQVQGENLDLIRYWIGEVDYEK